MFIRFPFIMCRIFLFYVLGIFLLSADFKTYCDKENFYCHKEYVEDFKSGSISRILFIKSEIMEAAKINLRETIMKTNEEYGKAIEAGSSDYSLKFKIVGDYRAVNIRQVVFDEVEADPSVFHLYKPSWQLAEVIRFSDGII
ncbi:hypothetical protein [Borrelia venezuelensis]|uniref:hypothetical protein n=1 Tax=Borrelia venezuelensis TaxID=1653839 RepID=UPI0024BF106D|nr:hypothetical protein [Borrelia venezuelensis]UPA12659.1 hypothetical protein bvRMA01_000993 [Borrelia venezuelensis]